MIPFGSGLIRKCGRGEGIVVNSDLWVKLELYCHGCLPHGVGLKLKSGLKLLERLDDPDQLSLVRIGDNKKQV